MSNGNNATYQIQVEGQLDTGWSDWLGGAEIAHVGHPLDAATSQLRVAVRDQAALYGLLARLSDLGLTLLAVQRVKG